MDYKHDYKDISELSNWDKNPRDINDKELARLKLQIQELGIYKPFIILEDGTVIGGNMRLKACRDLGIKGKVPVSIIYPKNEKEKIQYALSDNDRAGFYIEADVRQLVLDNPDLELTTYSIDLGEQTSLQGLMDDDGLDDDYSQKLGEVVYEPKETNHKVSDIFQKENKFDKEIESLENEEIKEMLRHRVAYFSNFDFPKIADYYAYQATPEEQRIMEKLALVLLDKDQLIENGFSKIISELENNG